MSEEAYFYRHDDEEVEPEAFGATTGFALLFSSFTTVGKSLNLSVSCFLICEIHKWTYHRVWGRLTEIIHSFCKYVWGPSMCQEIF